MESVFHNRLTCMRCGQKGLVGACDHWEEAVEEGRETCNFHTDCFRCGWAGWKEVRVNPTGRGVIRMKKKGR